uniref:B-cell lymphoma 3 protein-like n=1 Tax=Gouania willdenowi TaxID=441366 RepID=A0A8C5D7N5_GOUWI
SIFGDVDELCFRALHIAVVQGEFSIIHRLIHLLMKARRSLDIYNNLRQTPLHLAVITNQRDMVEALLRGGADPSALDRNGHTCLHLCSEYDHIECLSVLLRSSFTPLEITNYEGRTALHVAVLQRHVHVVQMLLKAGANINATDIKSGQSPLMLAVETNNTPMVHFLLQSGCEVNSRSYGGNTALHGACGRGQVDTVHLLLKNGADISLKNSHNDTPLMVAANKKVADVLRGKRVKHHDVVTEHKDGENKFTFSLESKPTLCDFVCVGSSSPGLRHRAFYSPQSVSYHTCGNIDYLHPTKHQICERRT